MKIIKYGVLGKEIGESGTPHLQGYLQLNGKQTIRAFQKKLIKVGVKCTILAAKGSLEQNETYCSKDGDTTEWGVKKASGKRNDLANVRDMIRGGATDEEIIEDHPGDWFRYNKSFDKYRKIVKAEKMKKELLKEMTGANLKEWQDEAVTSLLDQDDRKVLWIVDPKGNSRKSFLSKWLNAIHKAFEVTSGKTSDIAYAYNFEEIVVFDFARQKEDYVNYGVIEDFKNGRLFSPKYESKSVRFKSAKIIVFSNWEPDQSMLSEDRWDIRRLSEEVVNTGQFVFAED